MAGSFVVDAFAPGLNTGGFFTSLALGHALASSLALSRTLATGAWFERSGFLASFGGGLGHHHFSVHHGGSPYFIFEVDFFPSYFFSMAA